MDGKLDNHEGGKVQPGRKMSDSDAKARFFHEVSDAHLARIMQVDLTSELFIYEVALARAQLMDGKPMVVAGQQEGLLGHHAHRVLEVGIAEALDRPVVDVLRARRRDAPRPARTSRASALSASSDASSCCTRHCAAYQPR